MPQALKSRQRVGKYRIEGVLGRGGHADVYRARDEIEGTRVALKVPHAAHARGEELEELLREVRIGARLEHPNILPVKNAEIVDGRLIIAYRLGRETLEDRLRRRLATRTAIAYAFELLEALAFAHHRGVIHCDVKPANLILMPDGVLRLTDFGVARAALRTVQDGSGSGTVGYMAPEQAFGRPSFRSDVFSAGLVIYEVFTKSLPEWPFEWPPTGHARLRRRLDDPTIDVIRRALEVNARARFADGEAMLAALRKAQSNPGAGEGRRRRSGRSRKQRHLPAPTWRQQRERDYARAFAAELPHDNDCAKCGGPLSAAMDFCPWCSHKQGRFRGKVRFPASCRRCGRGRKLDWRFCPWCWGAGFDEVASRHYTDKRYTTRCSEPGCNRQKLMPFMRYCPQCHAKVTKRWTLAGGRDRCSRCGWGVATSFWSHCPWCAKKLS